MENSGGGDRVVRVLCKKLLITENGSGLQWLIGSPFLSDPPAIISTVRCIHTLSHDDVFSPDYQKEADDIRTLLMRGLHVNGALIVQDGDAEKLAASAIDASRKLRRALSSDNEKGSLHNQDFIGVVVNPNTHCVSFFMAKSETNITSVASIIYEKNPEKYVWDDGCLLHCQVPVKLPVCVPSAQGSSDMESIFLHASEGVIAKLKDPQAAYMVETLSNSSAETPRPAIIHGVDLEIRADSFNGQVSDRSGQVSAKLLSCADFCLTSKQGSSFTSIENADTILVTLLLNSSKSVSKSTAPIAEYLPATEEARLLVVSLKLEVICYAPKNLLLKNAIQSLVIPGLIDQLNAMKNATLPKLFTQHPKLHPYHFSPPGFVHPVTAIYELNYGETEMKQVEVRKSLHTRLGLPYDRPLLRVSNSLSFDKNYTRNNSVRKGPSLLRDVHTGIPSSGVSGGSVSLIQGSYEYYHYMHDGFDDSGWGCAYRSLQTIISWFRLQQYTNIDVPSHKEIQQALVEIGDKDPSFIGSREWIGAIELSFVLDKLLGVSCKVMNVRSGAELPEKCRELALHFETQGTPIMIGGGVLAYTLLGIDYNEASGDCAFLILDPHYTGNDDLKKIVNSGWCGWKKAVDSKGKNFFLHDKFYNLLLPQRPNMV